MRRLPVIFTFAAAAVVVLTGCGGTNTPPADPGQSEAVAPALDSEGKSLGPLPETSGKVSAADDLCRIVDADVARQALGYSGDMETETTEISEPIREGIVACTYRGTVDGQFAAVLLSVQRYDATVWGYGVKSMDLKGGKRVSQPGADEVVVWDKDGRTVQSRVGDYQAQAINGTNGRFPEDGLARLATVAAKAAV